ncbi:MAG: plastocyanin/azurin family copper-binding protein, partial [Patescibacteria group bacterium]
NTNTSTSTATTTSSSSGAAVGASVSVGSAKTVTVTYSASTGFSPKSVTVNKGDTIKFVSENGQMWVAGDEHPSHTEYDGTSRQEHCATVPSASFDQCSSGTSYSFTFTKAGTFDYHNHVASSQVGVVIVK